MVVDESTEERTAKNAHTINVQHVHHVLLGYHLGRDRTMLTIQPRPFEGAEWDLVGGQRIVEGMQDMIAIASIPPDVTTLKVQVCATIGFLGRAAIEAKSGPAVPLDPHDLAEHLRSQIGDLLSQGFYDQIINSIDQWEKYIEKYRRWAVIGEFLESEATKKFVVTAELCAKGEIDVASGPNSISVGAAAPVFQTLEMRFAEVAGPSTPSRAVIANSLARSSMDIIRILHASPETGKDLGKTAFGAALVSDFILSLPKGHRLRRQRVAQIGLTKTLASSLALQKVVTIGDLVDRVRGGDGADLLGGDTLIDALFA